MAVIKNKKTGMWEVRTYYKNFDWRKEAEDQEGLCEEKRSPRMGNGNFKLKENQSINMNEL